MDEIMKILSLREARIEKFYLMDYSFGIVSRYFDANNEGLK